MTYTYDAGGNILGKTEYTYTTGELGSPTRSVVYGYTDSTWKDLLTSYDGTAITYDTIGNPLNWRGGMSFTWQNGRQLAGISKDGLTASYAYNDSGIRLSKTVNGVATQYYLNGSMIVAEVTGDVQTDYYYDESGNVFGFKRGNSEYYYIRNGQGDIIGILDSSGTQIVSYVYDSWGKLVSISGSQAETIGETNPFRYRGYYYDTETGLYYLQSRYYDPEVGRWINADDPGIIDGANDHILENNLFAYCFNNPINMEDQTGLWPDWIKKAAGAVKDFASSNVGKIVIGAAAIGVGVIATVATGGAAAPALIGGIKAACIAGGISAGISATTTAVKSAASGDSLKTVLKKSAGAAVDGFADGFMTGGIMAGASQVASAGFKTAAKFGVKSGNKSGIQIGKNAKILSPDQPWHKNNGGTLIKIGNIRIDVGSNTLLHMHLPGVFSRVHLPIGTIGAGIYGGVKR